jgi:6-pyruvoyltetrahydropterin/6-carboxytetrahydropterin synthase
MPIARVTRRVHFSAGHRLHNPDLSAAENRDTYGLCNNPTGHGHNYDLEVTVEGPVDPVTGYVMDLKRLKGLLEQEVLADVDHANLNVDVDWLAGVVPTTENLAVAIWHRLRNGLSGVKLIAVRLWETDRNSVEYRGE